MTCKVELAVKYVIDPHCELVRCSLASKTKNFKASALNLTSSRKEHDIDVQQQGKVDQEIDAIFEIVLRGHQGKYGFTVAANAHGTPRGLEPM